MLTMFGRILEYVKKSDSMELVCKNYIGFYRTLGKIAI